MDFPRSQLAWFSPGHFLFYVFNNNKSSFQIKSLWAFKCLCTFVAAWEAVVLLSSQKYLQLLSRRPRQAGLPFSRIRNELSKQSPGQHIKDWEQQPAEESPFLYLWVSVLLVQTAKDAAICTGQKLKGGQETQGRGFSLIYTALKLCVSCNDRGSVKFCRGMF